MKSGLTFITNEHDVNLKERLKALIVPQTRLFDCLVGYFYLSGFHLLHPALECTEKIRILVGLKTDGLTFELLEEAKGKALFSSSQTPKSGIRSSRTFDMNLKRM